MDATDQVGTKESAIAAHFLLLAVGQRAGTVREENLLQVTFECRGLLCSPQRGCRRADRNDKPAILRSISPLRPPAAGAVLSGETASTLGTSR